MFTNIDDNRLLGMSAQEQRWLDNIKKAIYDSDMAILNGTPQERCLEGLVKAVDVAKNLRESLQGKPLGTARQKERFIEFIELEVPSPDRGGLCIPLINSRTGKAVDYSFAMIVYEIRCMIVHENENLDASEKPNHHIKLDWTKDARDPCFGAVSNGELTCSGAAIAQRLRQVLAKFVTGIEGMINWKSNRSFSIGIDAPLGSIRPKVSTQPDAKS